MTSSPSSKVMIVWSSGDREVALNMVFVYALNSKQRAWWGEVTLLIWGPSARLLAEDSVLQGQLKSIIDEGVRVTACKQCADTYAVSETLIKLGVEVFYTGQMLTDWIKAGRPMMTF
jgi:hypothetical protein